MTEYICTYCREIIKRSEEGVLDKLSGQYFHNSKGCSYKDKNLPKLPEIDEANGGVTCYNLYVLTNFEKVKLDIVPLT